MGALWFAARSSLPGWRLGTSATGQSRIAGPEAHKGGPAA